MSDIFLCKHGRFVSNVGECALHPKTPTYYLFRPWIVWLVPFALLIRLAKWKAVEHNVWYQDDEFQLQGSTR